MIDAVGRVMLYVNNPREVADFWTQKLGFVEVDTKPGPEGTLQIEVTPTKGADTTLVLFNREVIARLEPELPLGAPSILFSCHNLEETHKTLKAKGVQVGEIGEIEGMKTFNFPDIEGNYFAVREV